MNDYIIEIENLSHRFPDGTMGLNGVDLLVRRGELMVIAGENGSGKTTLIKHLNGLILPDSGIVKLDGIPVSKDLVRARRFVGMVFQDSDSQIVGDTVYDDVAFGPENLCMERSEINRRVSEALKIVGLSELSDKRPYLLSGGEKRRLAIAGVLVMEPEVVVFDEPFSGLDYFGFRQVLKEIYSLKQSGKTIIIITHDIEKILVYTDSLVFLKEGKVAKTGSPEELVKESEQFGVREPCDSRQGLEISSWLN